MTIQEITTEFGTSYLQCDCDRTAVRIRTQSNGVKIYAEQCLDCGRQIRAVSKNAPEIIEMPNRLPFDDELKEAWRLKQEQHRQRQSIARETDRLRKNQEWWRWYTEYLESTAWRMKRQAVMTRADNWCEGCRARQAVQVHHLTYKHVGNEFLFELVAVCLDCHSRLHAEADYDA